MHRMSKSHFLETTDVSPQAPTITVGTPAPDFTLPVSLDRQMTVSDLRGSPVVLVFYPGDWSPVCTDSFSTLVVRQADLGAFGATLVGISVDGVFSLAPIAEARGIDCGLLADFEPKGAVARGYGVYRDGLGFNRRALVGVDRDGKQDHDPGADEVLEAVREVASSW